MRVQNILLFAVLFAVLLPLKAYAADVCVPPCPIAVPQSETISTQCWSKRQLATKRDEQRIDRSRKRKRANTPDHAPSPLPPLAKHLQGSIRSVSLPDGKKLLALTFDLCEGPREVAGYEGRIVDYLRQHNIKATFFAGGHWLKTHRIRALQLLADPLFEVGNHSWSHANMGRLSGKSLTRQINLTQAAYEDARAELKPYCLARNSSAPDKIPDRMKLFRFPYGSCSPAALQAVAKAGLAAIQWSIATGDPARGQSARRIARTVLSRARPGAIIIAHANGRGWHSARALPLFIPRLLARGYQFVTISELLLAGTPNSVKQCYNERPGDIARYLAGHRHKARRAARRHKKSLKKKHMKRHKKRHKKRS